MNYDAPRTTSTTPPNTLRTRRPPSRNIDGDSYGAHTTAASSTLQPIIHNPLAPYRPTASPVPSRHPSRASTAIHDSNRATVSRSGRDSQRTSSNSSSNFWDSPWSSFQDLASQLLNGSDASEETLAARPQARKRRPLAATHDRITSAPPAQWGPAGTAGKELGKGSKEDRLAHVQAKKREGLLAANGHVLPDITGRFKRRDSDELHRGSVPPAETDDRDALVYLHPVKPQDTMAGVMIKYNCEANIFRKANRLWPNDSIQIRKVVMLPVEACGVKGRKLPDAAPTPELLNEASDEDFMPTPTAHRPPWPFTTQNQHPQETPFSSVPSSPSISVTGPPADSEPPWKHDSWVTIDGFASAVEIARLPRRTLGFFPRSRRKSPSNSHSHSDIGGSTPPPSSSLDLPRLSLQSISSLRRGGGNDRSRSSSSAAAKHPSPFQLHGPGGVGTLGKDVRGPGPAPDGLNKLFPNVAPRDSSESHRSADDHPSSSSAAAALGIENVGGVIEGWVRKMAWSVVRSPRAVSRTREREEEVFELTDAVGVGEEEVDHRRRRGGGG
ncbi:MAG: hypothetical protein LQ344_006799 [Seirophora lacunosa]|nr:MAG: hypothetical protein LQ344_006799 [Seirophora lacunosa]